MSALLIAVLALTAPPPEGVEALAVTPPAATPPATAPAEKPQTVSRSGPELRDAVRAALPRWARPADAEADRAACEFLMLYQELQRDDQLSAAQREYFVTKVRSRLFRLSDQIAKRVAIEKRLAKAKDAEAADAPEGKSDSMSQASSPPDRQGDAGMFGGGAMQVPDHGEVLVDLIQRTIAPNTWDINGGPGSIYYWYPGRAIVVRQMGEVHGQITDLLEQMGRMGR